MTEKRGRVEGPAPAGHEHYKGWCNACMNEGGRLVTDPAPAGLDERLLTAVLKFYADQMPAYAAAAGLDREELAAVMVDVNRVRAWLSKS